ncbi:MAG: endonuclease domain-containing protein [Chloroflexota bacterium]|nr:endonuclease domain-containing protein [Chloroflexota bacterium]
MKEYSRRLRGDMPDAEKLVWSKVRRKQLKGLQFYRQRIIGNYIVDFHCPKAKLIIEIDGSQHYTAEGIQNDNVRDDYMSSNQLRVLRFSNREVLENIEGVVEKIYGHL